MMPYGIDEWRRRWHEVNRGEVLTRPMAWWYLSFADETGFLGGVLVRAWGAGTASALAHATGCNPGGEIWARRLRDDFDPPEAWQFRLMSKEDMEREIGPTLNWADEEEKEMS